MSKTVQLDMPEVVVLRRDLKEARRDMLDQADALEGCGLHAGKTLTNDDVMKVLRISFRLRELARGDR